MALVLADRVQETTNTTGTGTLTLAGAVAGFQSFSVIGDTNTTYYTIVSGNDWEVGVGTYTSAGTLLSRDTVYSSSAAGAKITVAAGAKVFVTYPSSRAVATNDIGVTVQAYDAQLADVAGLTPTDNGVIIGNGTNFVVESGATLKTSLGLTIGTDVQAWDADLDTWATKTAPTGVVVGTTDTQTLTNKTLTDPAIVGTILEDVFTITDGAAFEINPGNGSVQLITLGASRTPKATNFAAGESITLMVNDGTAYTLTWTDTTFGTGGVIWVGGTAPTLATTGYTVIEMWKVSTQVYGARVGDVA